MRFSEYTIKGKKEVLDILNSSENGISDKEAENRLKIYGFNEIKEREVSLFDVFSRQFKSPFFYLLFIAAIIAFLVGEIIDGFVILVFILINVFLGFFQEARAQKAISLLKKFIPSETRVLRRGEEKTIDKKFLVPGDIVLLGLGNIAPADLRIIKTENFLVDESILTGESVAVPKIGEALLKEGKEIFEAENILFAGTSVISGEAEGVVIKTGRQTVLGEITKLVSGITKESAYEKNLLKFSRIILKIVVTTIVFVFLINIIIKGTTNFSDFLIFSIALTVSIIPEALPIVATFSFSQGALRMAKKKVVVKRLSAIEDLGNIEILCTDKTGTLTENKLSLERIFSSEPEKCLLYGLLSSSFLKEEIESVENPFDSALFQGAPSGIKKRISDFKAISEIPFEPNRLKNSVLLEDKERRKTLIVRGALEAILEDSSEFPEGLSETEIRKEAEKEGAEGKRILAVAFKEFGEQDYSEEDEKDLKFLGYFSFRDPLKKTAKGAVELAEKLGVQIKILTGDSFEVAGAVAKEIGLIKNPKTEVILGESLSSFSAEEFAKKCEKFKIFARVSPEIKLKIIQALQKKFEIGFLGEGFNDAPALKIANVAIAVEGAADISKEVSDIILLKKDLRVIVDGIREGRNIFSNINKYIKCTLSSNFGNFYSIAIISLAIPFLPMLPIQILLVNLLSDFPLIAVATDKVDTEELRKPKLYQLHYVIWLVVLLALVSTVFDFIFFGIFHKVDVNLLRTLWFIESILTEIALIFSIRTRRFFLKAKMPSLTLLFLSFLAFGATVFLPFTNFGKEFFHFVSPPISAVFIVFFLIISYFIVSEIVKLIYFSYKNKTIKVESR